MATSLTDKFVNLFIPKNPFDVMIMILAIYFVKLILIGLINCQNLILSINKKSKIRILCLNL